MSARCWRVPGEQGEGGDAVADVSTPLVETAWLRRYLLSHVTQCVNVVNQSHVRTHKSVCVRLCLSVCKSGRDVSIL